MTAAAQAVGAPHPPRVSDTPTMLAFVASLQDSVFPHSYPSLPIPSPPLHSPPTFHPLPSPPLPSPRHPPLLAGIGSMEFTVEVEERHRSVPPNEPHPKHSTINRVSPSPAAAKPHRLYKSKSSSDISPDASPGATAKSIGDHSPIQRHLSFQTTINIGADPTNGDSPRPKTKWQISSVKRNGPRSVDQ